MADTPEGWRLVPVEPTREMLEVVVTQDDGCTTYDYNDKGILEKARRHIWQHMLAASPTPLPDEGDGKTREEIERAIREKLIEYEQHVKPMTFTQRIQLRSEMTDEILSLLRPGKGGA